MRKVLILVIAIATLSLLVLSSCVAPPGAFPFQQPRQGQPYPYPSGNQQPYPYGPGGGWSPGMGPGMMGGGMGPGMMGGGYPQQYNPQAQVITIDQAADAVQSYLKTYYGGRLTLTEVMDFAWNYYAEIEEEDTGIHATELLIDKYTGRVYPEMGPNMMWNTKYGPMVGMMGNYGSGPPTANMSISADKAKTLAQQYLDTKLPDLTVEEADIFYGYYTLHTLKNGEVEGMLSINGYSGAVWYHSWHGPFIGMKEYE